MKRVVAHQGAPVVEDVEPPVVEPGCVLVDVAWSTISPGTETIWIHESPRGIWWRLRNQPITPGLVLEHVREQGAVATFNTGRGLMTPPRLLGYSCAGIVREVGPGIDDLAAGDRVACVGPDYACHAEVVSVPRNLVAEVPEQVSLRAASSVALGGIAMQALRCVDARLGETTVVLGLGLIGQLVAQALAAAGCNVIAIDPDARRTERVAPFVAHALAMRGEDALEQVTVLAGRDGVDAAVIATPALPGLMQIAAEMVRVRGRLLLVGAVDIEVHRRPAWKKELTVGVSRSFGAGYDDRDYERGADYPVEYVRWTINRNLTAYLQLLARGRMDAEVLVDSEVAIEDAPQAYAAIRDGIGAPIRTIFRYPFSKQAS